MSNVWLVTHILWIGNNCWRTVLLRRGSDVVCKIREWCDWSVKQMKTKAYTFSPNKNAKWKLCKLPLQIYPVFQLIVN